MQLSEAAPSRRRGPVGRHTSHGHRLELTAAVVSEPEHQGLSRDHLPKHLGVRGEVISNGGANEVGAVRIEALRHEEIDVAEVDDAEVDRQLLGGFGGTSTR